MISAEELDLVAAVEHPDPHHVLGPHVDEEGGFVVVRAFRPDALEIALVPDPGAGLGDAARPMRRVHAAGIFELTLPDAVTPFGYRLQIRYAADTFVLRDAYAYPPALGDLDLHLA